MLFHAFGFITVDIPDPNEPERRHKKKTKPEIIEKMLELELQENDLEIKNKENCVICMGEFQP